MTKVFIGGSRALGRLNPDVRRRLDSIMDKHHYVLVGDANGADKAVQTYLNSKNYREVEVFCVGRRTRNNVGSWEVRHVNGDKSNRGFDHYATKDRAMADEASVGFMVWDGESLGTLMNVCRLVAQHKPTVVYFCPNHAFLDVRHSDDLEHLIQDLEKPLLKRMKEQLDAEAQDNRASTIGERSLDQQELAI